MGKTEVVCKKKLIKYREQFLSVFHYSKDESETKDVANYAYAAVVKLLKYSIYDIELLKYLEVTFDSLLSQNADIASKESGFGVGDRRLFAYVEYLYKRDKDIAGHEAYKLYLHAEHLKETLLKKNKTSNAVQYYYAFASLCMCLAIVTRSSLRDILRHSPVLTRRLKELKNGIEIASTAVKKIEEEEKAIADKRKNEPKNTIANSDLSTINEDSTDTLPASDNSTAQKSKAKTTQGKASPLRNANSGMLDDSQDALPITPEEALKLIEPGVPYEEYERMERFLEDARRVIERRNDYLIDLLTEKTQDGYFLKKDISTKETFINLIEQAIAFNGARKTLTEILYNGKYAYDYEGIQFIAEHIKNLLKQTDDYSSTRKYTSSEQYDAVNEYLEKTKINSENNTYSKISRDKVIIQLYNIDNKLKKALRINIERISPNEILPEGVGWPRLTHTIFVLSNISYLTKRSPRATLRYFKNTLNAEILYCKKFIAYVNRIFRNELGTQNAHNGQLDDLHPAVKIFKRFVALNGKEYNRAKVERILKSLQREIINHTITKDYEYASEVNHLQKKLVDALNLETALGKQTGKIEIETDLLARLQHIIGEAKPADAIALLKSYVRLAGSTDKDKAKRLLKRFDRYNMETPSRALTPHLKSAKNALSDFVAGKSAAIALDEFALHGLNGSEGLDGILPSEKLQSLTFDTIPVEHPFNKLLGQPEIPFRVMIHGAPGSGKTTLGLRIAYSLAANNGLRTLVVSSEEGIGYKIQQRLNKLGLYHPNLFVSNRLPSDLAGYQVVLLDSIVSLGLNAEQLRTLYSENPETSFIIINQETKQGNSRGSLELEHDVDTIVRCQDMVATTLKNRFGSLDSMQIR